MYIQPDAKVYLLTGVPLDLDCQNTMWWIDQATQLSTMQSYAKYTYTPVTYQRANKDSIRVQHTADELYDVNYMMFQNTHFGNKWFYAFVTSVDYINHSVTEIHYKIDVIQTWYFDFTPMYSFVERCHSATDTIGDNIVAEPVSFGEYVGQEYERVDSLREMAMVIQYVDTDSQITPDTQMNLIDNVPSGTLLKAFNTRTNGRHNAKAFLKDSVFMQAPDNVVAMYVVPEVMIVGEGYQIPDEGMDLPFVNLEPIKLTNILALDNASTIDGYTPYNKKLFTYPYNFITVSNNCGSSMTLRYEFFQNLQADLVIKGTASPPVSCKLYPLNYKGSEDAPLDPEWQYPNANTLETLTLEGYPMCSWNVDYFKAWLAQNSIPMMIKDWASMGHQATTVATRGLDKNSIASVSHIGINTVADILTETYNASIHADIVKGNPNSGNVNVADKRQTFYYCRTSLNYQQAEIIDSFFSRFGYAQNRVMLPPRHNRQNYTYVKTIGCKISGTMPADDEKEICDIFDRGVTFWTDITKVGNFSVNNGLLT